MFPAQCSPARKGISTGVAEVDILSSRDVDAQHDVSTVGRLGFIFDGRRWREGNTIGAPLLHIGIHGGWMMDLVRFLDEEVVDVAVVVFVDIDDVLVRMDDGVDGSDVY